MKKEELIAYLKESLKVFYAVDVAKTGKDGEDLIFSNDYDVIILDVGLPDIDGFKICQEIRENGIKTPIIMLTGRSGVEDKINAFNLGADDYLTKPFSFEELHARIQALIRRSPNLFCADKLVVGDLVLDTASNFAEYKGKRIELRLREFRLLEFLMRNKNKILTRSMIFEHVWNSDDKKQTNTVDVHINYLRNKIDKKFGVKMIKSVHGLGYKIIG
jgi:DNA-binding response OmpR family regulator